MLPTYVKPLSSGSVFPWLTADRIVTTNSLSQLATPSSVSTAQSVTLSGSATLTVAGLITAQSGLTVSSNASISGTGLVTGPLTVGNGSSGNGVTINHLLAQAPISLVAGTLPSTGGRVGLAFSGGATANNLNRYAITAYATENWVSGGASGTELRFELAAIGASARTDVLYLRSTAVTVQSAANLVVNNTTDASSKDTGSIITEGGVGIEKALNVGTTITCAGTLTVNYDGAIATIGTGVGSATVRINGASATNRLTRYMTNGSVRWDFAANATAESGGNAGSDFTLSAYTDAGAYIDDPLLVQRVAGGFLVTNRPIYSNPTTGVALTISSTNAAAITCAGGILLDGATTKTIKYTNGTANAAVAVTFGAVGPTGSTAGNQVGWLRVNVAGTDRYIPYW